MLGNLFKGALNGIKKEIIKTDNRQGGVNHHHNGSRNERRIEYFAVVKKLGSIYEGEIKDISMGRSIVNGCTTYDDLLTRLTKKLDEEVERCKRFNQPLPEKTSKEALSAKYPNREIIIICSTVSYNR